MSRYRFTSESVTEGHPDKLCDQISDAILDAILAQDPRARVACETLAKTGMVVVAGEITTTAKIDFPQVVRQTIKEIGYTDSAMGFDGDTCAVLTAIEKQSPDISQGVTEGDGLHKEQGAGDQGLDVRLRDRRDAQSSCRRRSTTRTSSRASSPRSARRRRSTSSAPTARRRSRSSTRTTSRSAIDAIVVSTQHDEKVKHKQLREAIIELVIEKVLPKKLIDKNTKIHVNPTGRFVVGGPHGDCGLTGRKIIVDTYGGMGRHGGGAFSGKDPSKVDRSACYYARFVAKNVVASGSRSAARCRSRTRSASRSPSACT